MTAPSPSGMTTQPSTFECSICDDTHHDTSITIKGDAVCKGCFDSGIKPQFFAALKDESQYPVRWGDSELNIFDFAPFFPKIFLEAWLERTRLYAVLPGERIHCAGKDGEIKQSDTCGRFLGLKSARPAGRKCDVCDARTCTCCGGLIEGALKEHECKDPIDEAETLKELNRGTDYQKCPGCGGVVQLQDGCNHLVCSIPACRTHFCYICGEEADAASHHWDSGKPCPKYNQPGAANALFNDDPAMFDLLPANLFPVDPARREAINILRDRSQQDLLPTAIQPDDSPELILRKLDRRELDRIAHEANRLEDEHDEGHFNEPFPFRFDAVADLAEMLSSLVELYTIRSETNQTVRQIVFNAGDTLQEDLEDMVEDVGEVGFGRFPTLRRIVDSYQLAVRGEFEELRRQTRD